MSCYMCEYSSHRAAYLCENESWGNIFAWAWGHSTTPLVLYMSCHMYEWVMAHMNESLGNIFARGLGHSNIVTPLVPYYFKEPTNCSHPIASICHVIHTHESRHLYTYIFFLRMRPLYDTISAIYVMSHVWMSHGATYLCENEAILRHCQREYVMSYIRMSHGTSESWGNIFVWEWVKGQDMCVRMRPFCVIVAGWLRLVGSLQ